MTDYSHLPALYSLRNCPYAMRARLALYQSGQTVKLRDIVLSDKPSEMLTASPKATVPVLVLADSTVLEESLDIMLWALHTSDPDNLLHSDDDKALPEMLALIQQFDTEFKHALEQYRCAKRYHEDTLLSYRDVCQSYVQQLESRLTNHLFLLSDNESLLDLALVPFIRQFARVERQWYLQSPYPNVRQWLNRYLQSKLFSKVMTKYPLWQEKKETVLFGKG